MVLNPFPQTPANIAVLGLGYVGLPLAVAFAAEHEVVGFDTDAARISELSAGLDRTLEVSSAELQAAVGLRLTHQVTDLAGCNVLIVTVPTPIDADNKPDLTALMSASATVGRVSGMTFNRDFFAGYSPERANPGDPEHRLADIVKVTAGSTPEAAAFVDSLYASVVKAGTHRASSIRVAEAAKVIENTQRDLNIALVNEFALIFQRMGIDTEEVLAAASSKWNFLNFRPGLVGGHCIGVDPYYLTYKAETLGYRPEVILAGRTINDSMGGHVARELVKEMIRRGSTLNGARILIMGLAFKENTPDVRNSRVIDIIRELQDFGAEVDVWDPWIAREVAKAEHQIDLVDQPSADAYDGLVLAVAHREFAAMGAEQVRSLCRPGAVIFDVKWLLPRSASDLRL